MISDLDIKINKVVSSLREEFDIDATKPVDLPKLLENLIIVLKEVKLTEGVYGSCKTIGRKRLITIDPDIPYPNQKRFVICHEIGHILLHQSSYICSKIDFEIWQAKSEYEKELEANAFAAELLLPKKYVVEQIKKADLSFKFIKELAERYEATFTSAAIAAVNAYNDEATIVCHKNGAKIWSYNSNECFYTIISRINISDSNNIVNATLWINEDDDQLKCEQETIYFKNLDLNMTILKFFKY